jgi:ssDNA-binding Zn-finger/Zn-ribbon topoisomerase 1
MTFVIGTPHTKGAGYYRSDNTPSGGQLVEADVQTCAHCQKVLLLQQWRENGAWCHRGQHPLCPECGDIAEVHGCQTWIQLIETAAEREYARAQYRRMVGV